MKKSESKKNSSESILEEITRTMLYEGYSLYPYYRSSAKNVKPVPFGAVYPQQYQKYNREVHSTTQTECIVKGSDKTEVTITIRFLHLRNKRLLKIDHEELGQDQFNPAGSLEAGGQTHTSGWEAEEREIDMGTYKISTIVKKGTETNIAFQGKQASDLILGKKAEIAANIIITQSDISGKVTVSANPVGDHKNGFRITVKITNTTPVKHPGSCSRDEIYGLSFLSTHTILQTGQGTFVSQTDPDTDWEMLVSECKNVNTWPVLIDSDDITMLSSPIVLYDYPEIAPESTGYLFDSTEIEEALMLHMATLPEQEKRKIDKGDGKMKAMLRRVESVTPEELMKLHGGFKEVKSDK